MTLALRTQVLLAQDNEFGNPDYFDMSPAVCVLTDGTIIVASVRWLDSPYVQLWHLSAAGGVLGTDTYPGVATNLDITLAAIDGNRALLFLKKGTITEVVEVSASGGSFSFSGHKATGGPAVQWTGFTKSRFAHVHDGMVLLNGATVSLYTTSGDYIDSADPGMSGHTGWGVDPANPARVAIVAGSGDIAAYLMTPTGLVPQSVSPNIPQPRWSQGASNPFVDPRRMLDIYGYQDPYLILDAETGVQVGSLDTSPLMDFPNVEWAVHPLPGNHFLLAVDGGWDDYTFNPVVVRVSGDTAEALRLSYGGPQVSLNYGSYTWAVRGDTAVLASHTTSTESGVGDMLNVYVIDVGAPTVEGVLAIDTHDHPWHVVGTRDPAMPYELVIDTGTERVVEIVAGEEHLATHELVVDETGRPGTPWSHAGLFRPI